MPTLQEVYSKAEADFVIQDYEPALAGYLSVVVGAPEFTRARYRVADTLLNLGDRQRAKDVYRALAWYYIKAGYPLLGLVVCKMVLALDPGYTDILYILAELYSSESDRVSDVEPPQLTPLPDGVQAPELFAGPAEELMDIAAAKAADTDDITKVPGRLPLIPLFSHLGEEPFIKVLGSLRLRRHTSGQRIITEGERGDSFFMLADGVVVVSKQVNGVDTVLAHLHPGAVFGEMALVSNASRAATVAAMGDVDLLELSRRDLEEHAGELESVKQALRKFTRGRFLANLAATSPLFRPLSKPDRRALMAKFVPRVVYPDDIIIEEGEEGKGLFLVLRGEFKVISTEAGTEADVAVLKGGDVFGEISLLHGTPTTAKVMATSVGEVLFLPKESFVQMLETHPDVARTLSSLSEERLRELKKRTTQDIITDDERLLL